MKALNTLIRIHKRNLDELRRNMVALENQKAQLEQAIIILHQELDKEIALASKQPEMSNFFGEFAKRIKGRQETLRQEIIAIDIKVNTLNDEIFAEFTEIKKFEIARENKKNRLKDAENRKETLMLDEIASQQFQKKQN
jgi:flagellar export protein FliJ